MPLQLLSVIVLGLMCGSEMNVAVFGHPTLRHYCLEETKLRFTLQ
jgi:hypothetical protein